MADELYGLTPPEFIPRRDARAAEARKAGDRALAAEVKKLRRPTTGAWLANVLARQRRQQVARLLDLGAALRQAQASLATTELRRLAQERHAVLSELEREARDLASHYGQAVSGAVAQELSATLDAALADPEAAGALRAARLTTGLHYSGLGLGLIAVPEATEAVDHAADAADRPPHQSSETGALLGSVDGEAQSRLKAAKSSSSAGWPRQADPFVRDAEAALAAAEQDAVQRQRQLDEAREKRDRCHEEVADLERQLRALRKTAETADDDVRAAKKELDAAEHAVIAARDELVRARAPVGPPT